MKRSAADFEHSLRPLSDSGYGGNGTQLPLRNVYQIGTLIFR